MHGITVRFADTRTMPEDDECIAEWKTPHPPAAGDVVVLRGEPYTVTGRLWRGRGICYCRLAEV